MASEPNGSLVVPVWSDSGVVKPLADNNGNIPVSQDTPANLLNGVHGYDGSNWQKLSLLFGYTDRWTEQVSELNAVAGTNLLYSVAVPAGYIYVLNAALAFNAVSACNIDIGPFGGVFPVLLAQGAGLAAGTVLMTGYCNCVLKEGDQVRAGFTGCVAGDDLYLRIWGYKMGIGM